MPICCTNTLGNHLKIFLHHRCFTHIHRQSNTPFGTGFCIDPDAIRYSCGISNFNPRVTPPKKLKLTRALMVNDTPPDGAPHDIEQRLRKYIRKSATDSLNVKIPITFFHRSH